MTIHYLAGALPGHTTLLRSAEQFHLERDGRGRLDWADVDNALDEMLFSGGSLNLKLLGAEGAT